MDIHEEWDGDVLSNIGVGFLQVQGEKKVTFSDHGSDDGWLVQGHRGTKPSKSRPPAKTPDPASDAPVAAEKPAWIVESCLRNKRQGYQRVSQKSPKNAVPTRVQVHEPTSVSQQCLDLVQNHAPQRNHNSESAEKKVKQAYAAAQLPSPRRKLCKSRSAMKPTARSSTRSRRHVM